MTESSDRQSYADTPRDFWSRVSRVQCLEIVDPDTSLMRPFVAVDEMKQLLADSFQDFIIVPENLAIFCILLSIGQGLWMTHFRYHGYHGGINDSALPFDPTSPPSNWPQSADFLIQFCEAQWIFCAPRFRAPFVGKKFPPDMVLPIIYKKALNTKERIASLWHIRIHPSYNGLISEAEKSRRGPLANDFVMKSYLGSEAEHYYNAEVTKFRTLGYNPGIVEFYGSFARGKSYNIILEYTDNGSLADYFKKEPPPTQREEIIKFWESMFKLLSVLRDIHSLGSGDPNKPQASQGQYRNLKLESILIVSNGSESRSDWSFKLANAGISHFRRNKPIPPDGQKYDPPELYKPTGFGPYTLRKGRNCDIWSLGCIYSEAACWLDGGYQGIQAYEIERQDEIAKILGILHGCHFHNGEETLECVRRRHTISARTSLSKDITRSHIDMLIADMLNNEGIRPTASILYNRALKIVEQGRKVQDLYHPAEAHSSNLQATISGSSSSDSQHELSALGEAMEEMNELPPASSTQSTLAEAHFHDPTNFATSARTKPSAPLATRSYYSNRPDNAPKLPYLSLAEALEWKRASENNVRGEQLKYGQHLNSLRDHHVVFLVDDSTSMKQYWDSVLEVFEALSYLVKDLDPDGFELWFTGLSNTLRNCGETTAPLQALQYFEPEGTANIDFRLDIIVGEHFEALKKLSSNYLLIGHLPKPVKPLSLYILTDKVWEDGSRIPFLQYCVRQLSQLVKLDMVKHQLGIQFISFNQDQVSLKLKKSVIYKAEEPFNIVDVEPWNGNIWKMLLGTTDATFDDRSHSKDKSEYGHRVGGPEEIRSNARSEPFNELDQPAPTDSGFESGTHQNSTLPYSSEKEFNAVVEGDEHIHDSAFAESQCSPDEGAQDMGLYSVDTIYSASVASNIEAKGYMVELAAELFRTVKSREFDREAMEHIFNRLPDLLRAFALKVGHKPQSSNHLDVSFFVHKYRRRIQNAFEEMFQAEPPENATLLESSRMEFSELAIRRYLEEPQFEDNQYPEVGSKLTSTPTLEINENLDPGPMFLEPEDNDESSEDDVELTSNSHLYRDLILQSPEYSWLVANLQRELALTRAKPDVMEDIKRKILSALPSSHKQGYVETEEEALERAITLTGTLNDAQALSSREYLSQTWPGTGQYVVGLISQLIHTTGRQVSTVLPDGTEVDVQIQGNKFVATVRGTGDSLAELGQQFSWLGAALRSSPFEAGVAMCIPCVRSIRTRSETTDLSISDSEAKPFTSMFCEIGFDIEEPIATEETLPGGCWRKMFRNPVLVAGFPTLTKHEPGIGLEMSLATIAVLAGSERATIFNEKVFIKGFSTMLIATKLTHDILIWHYYYNRDGERISYLDHTLQATDDINLLQLEAARHVVGWCSDCKYNAGAADANYNIHRTGLPRPHSGCMLENISVSGGKIISGAVTIALGVKDIPIHLTRNGYILKLKWIATKYVVLWDEMDKRGWLVNGTSVLLHLVRASLEHYSTDDFSSSFLFEPKKMIDHLDRKPNSASKILSDPSNMELKIYPGGSESFEEEKTKESGGGTEGSRTKRNKKRYYLFQDLVEQHYNILEQIMDHHIHLAGQNGVKLKARVRNHLEGWDFVELATDHDPYPRVTTIQALGYGWVDFIRSIDAITLFGRGFGDIIQPLSFDGMCSNWRSLPTQKYYLGASVLDLKKIMGKFGHVQAGKLSPVECLLWHCPGDLVAPCPRCQSQRARNLTQRVFKEHFNPVQVFVPRWTRQLFTIKAPGQLEDLRETGAIVFGHNFSWGYHWAKDGRQGLDKGDPPPSNIGIAATTTPPGSSNNFRGVGESLASRSSQSREASTDPRTPTSTASTRSTPVEPIISPAQSSTIEESRLSYFEPRPTRQGQPEESRKRSLRHEKRRIS